MLADAHQDPFEHVVPEHTVRGSRSGIAVGTEPRDLQRGEFFEDTRMDVPAAWDGLGEGVAVDQPVDPPGEHGPLFGRGLRGERGPVDRAGADAVFSADTVEQVLNVVLEQRHLGAQVVFQTEAAAARMRCWSGRCHQGVSRACTGAVWRARTIASPGGRQRMVSMGSAGSRRIAVDTLAPPGPVLRVRVASSISPASRLIRDRSSACASPPKMILVVAESHNASLAGSPQRLRAWASDWSTATVVMPVPPPSASRLG